MKTSPPFEESFELLSLTLKTPESAADAAAVASTLHALVVLIEETQKELNIEGEFSIRVIPFKEGSLEIPIQVFLIGAAASLFTFNPGLSKVLDTLKTFFELKKLFKGDKPSEKALEDSINVGSIVINGSHNVINIIQQQRVEEAFDNAVNDLEKDESLTGVKLINRTSGEELADIPREQFKFYRIAKDEKQTNIPEERLRVIEVQLTVHTPALQGTAKWKFLHEGRQISASIKDKTFLNQVNGGEEAFRNGDRLRVDLEIEEKYVAAVSDYERTNRYVITKVHQHIPRPALPDTPSLFPDQREH